MELLLTIIIIRDGFLRDLARCNTNKCLRAAAAIDLGHENTKIRKSGKEVCIRMYVYVWLEEGGARIHITYSVFFIQFATIKDQREESATYFCMYY